MTLASEELGRFAAALGAKANLVDTRRGIPSRCSLNPEHVQEHTWTQFCYTTRDYRRGWSFVAR